MTTQAQTLERSVQIRKLAENGHTALEIARKLKISRKAVYRLVIRFQIELRPGYRQTKCKDHRNEQVKHLRKNGWSYGQIAKRYGITRARAHQIATGYRSDKARDVV